MKSVIVGIVLIAVFNVVAWAKDPPPPTPTLEQLPLQASVTQNGITWTFDKPAHVGRFITGDLYVVGPVTISAIDPKPLFGDEVKGAPEEQGDSKESLYKPDYARNGSTLDMPAIVPPNKVTKRTSRSGFDSRMPMLAYDANQFAKLPLAMKPGNSLVSTVSNEPLDRGWPIKALAILTCVGEPQPPDAFRPSYCQTATCKQYLARNLRRDLLLNLPLPPGTEKVKPGDYAAAFAQPWIDTVGYGRAMPRKNFSFYGPVIAETGGGSSLLLLLDYPAQEKEPLLLNMVQVGIDLHGLVRGGGGWPSEGGGAAGRKWLIMFAGLMLDDPKMYDLSKSYPDAEFHEDEQTAFCPVEWNGKTYAHGWTGAKVIWTGHYGMFKGKFRKDGRPLDDYGPVDLLHPAEWVRPWSVGSEGYRRGMTSGAWVAEALAAHLMHVEKFWNHDAFFAYADRWMTEDDKPFIAEMLQNVDSKLAAAKTADEKKALQDARKKIETANRCGTITGRLEMVPIVKYLWDTYRDHLPAAADGDQWPAAETTWK